MASSNDSEVVVRVLREKIAEKEKRVAELEKLMGERLRLTNEITALKTLIQREFGATPSAQKDKAPGLFDRPLPENVGLSGAIKHVLESAPPGGLRPIEVAGELERHRWQNTGKVPLPARVAAEMARLCRSGKLLNIEGRYSAAGG